MLTRLGDVAVAVFAADWQLIWCNRGWAALLGDPSSSPPQLRNVARDRFPIRHRPARLALWPVTELDTDAAVVSDLRRATGRFPHDTRLAALIGELSAGNQRFAELWATGTVATHRKDHKTIKHPSVGPVTVDCDVLTDGDSELKIVIMTAEPGSDHETKLQLAEIVGHPVTTNNSSHAGRQIAVSDQRLIRAWPCSSHGDDTNDDTPRPHETDQTSQPLGTNAHHHALIASSHHDAATYTRHSLPSR